MTSITRTSVLQLVIPLLLLILSPVCIGHEAVTCTGGTVTVGEEATITCHFQRDINASQHNFNVVYYPFNGSETDLNAGTYILLCNWGLSRKVECKIEEGYSFNNEVNSELTITVPVVKFEMAGRYVCQLVPDSGLRIEPCNLTVTKCHRTLTEVTEVTERVSAAEEDSNLVYVVFVVVLMIIIAALVSLLIYCQRKKICYHWKRIRRRHLAGGKSEVDGGVEANDENEAALLADLGQVKYQQNTANKQTHTYVDTVEKGAQVGTNVAVLTHERFTQVIDKDKEIFTGNFKANESDVVLYGSASRYNSPFYVTLGTPLVVVPDAVVERMRLKSEHSQDELEGAVV